VRSHSSGGEHGVTAVKQAAPVRFEGEGQGDVSVLPREQLGLSNWLAVLHRISPVCV